MVTRYELRSPLLSVARFFIDRVVVAMHRIVIRDMQERLKPRRPYAFWGRAPTHRGRRAFRILSD